MGKTDESAIQDGAWGDADADRRRLNAVKWCGHRGSNPDSLAAEGF